jgi:hypothetical protein
MAVVEPCETSGKSAVQQGINTPNTTNYSIIIGNMLQQLCKLDTTLYKPQLPPMYDSDNYYGVGIFIHPRTVK